MKRLLLVSLFVCMTACTLIELDARRSSSRGRCTRCNKRDETPPEFYVELVMTQDLFETVLEKNKLVIAYAYGLSHKDRSFVMGDGREEHTERWKFVDHNCRLIESYVEDYDERFDQAGVKWIAINLDRGDMDGLRKRYDIKQKDTLLFFKDKRLEAKQTITDGFNRCMLKEFLEKINFSDFVDEAICKAERKAAKAEKMRKRRRCCYSCYAGCGYGGWGPWYGCGYGCGYPYYRWNYGCGGCGFGCGFGWGCGGCW